MSQKDKELRCCYEQKNVIQQLGIDDESGEPWGGQLKVLKSNENFSLGSQYFSIP